MEIASALPTNENNIWSSVRLGGPKKETTVEDVCVVTADRRTPFEHDYDRLLFSTPVRRMADKTQVFPLDRNDSVRTRLTHSHEVSNLARSIGNRLVRTQRGIFGDDDADSAAPVILAAIGLAHDLGNPPFGHQGENAVRRWFKEKRDEVFVFDGGELSDNLAQDFLNFEGNAQTLRLVTRLQVSSGEFGLDLTAATLASLMKYTVPAHRAGKAASRPMASTKKVGYLSSEESIVALIRAYTGLSEGQRHPLTWLMEACDDIAYSVLDIEDAIKKAIVSPEDVLAYLRRIVRKGRNEAKENEYLAILVTQLDSDFARADEHRRPSKAGEIKASYLRARLIETLITGAAGAFVSARDDIFGHKREASLLEDGSAWSEIYNDLKSFSRTYAFNHPAVLRTELQGSVALSRLLDWFWDAIKLREDLYKPGSQRKTAFTAYAYSLISDNYRCIFEEWNSAFPLPLRYFELQLLTDMVSGMTDGFAMQLFGDLEPLNRA
jgi:dGTPase